METRVTLVSGLFYIGRDRWKYSGFPPAYDRYKGWIHNILSLNTNLILFTDEYYYDYILEVKEKYSSENRKLHLVKTSLAELETYQKYYNKMSCVMKTPAFVDHVKTNKVAEMCYPLYNVIMFDKVSLLEKAKQINPFEATHFYWTDAGAFRDNIEKYNGLLWPDERNTTFFNDKITFFSHRGTDYSIDDQKAYFTSQARVVHGGYFIVPVEKVEFLKEEFHKIVDKILAKEYVGSDEKVFDLICKRHPDQVSMVKADWFEFFELCKRPLEKDKTLKLVTVTWNYEETFPIEETNLYKSFKDSNPDLEFIHIHFNRSLYNELEREYLAKFDTQGDYILYKITLLQEKLKEIDSDYILFTDANDVVCLQSLKPILNSFDLENHVIVGREKNQWPMVSNKPTWPNYTDYDEEHLNSKTFINSGVVLAKKEKYIELLQSMIDNILPLEIKTFGGDQGIFTYHYTMHLQPSIQLDTESILVVNTYLRSIDEYKIENKKLVSVETNISPCLVHDNGWHYGSPKYAEAFNLLNLKTTQTMSTEPRLFIPDRLSTDSLDYHVLSNAAKAIKGVSGAICEIGTRRGGSAKYIIDALIENDDLNRNFVCIDPYGDIEYKASENYTLRCGYDNKMKYETMASLHEYVIDKPINLVALILEDTEFFKRFTDGVPFYQVNKEIVNQYALVFFDGPHDSESIYKEVEFFNSRSTSGTMWIFDDIDQSYPHDDTIEKWLFDNGWELVEKAVKKASYKKR